MKNSRRPYHPKITSNLLVGGNINWFVGKNLSAMVNYNAQLGQANNIGHQVNAGLNWNF